MYIMKVHYIPPKYGYKSRQHLGFYDSVDRLEWLSGLDKFSL